MSILFISFVPDVSQLLPFLMMLTLLCTGIGAVAVGIYIHTHPGKLNRGRKDTQELLLNWQVEQPGTSDLSILDEFIRSQDSLQSSALIGMGVSLIVVVIGTEILVHTATGTWYAEDAQLFFPAIFLGYLVGYGLGYVYGVRRLRRLSISSVTYADLAPRGLADYRARAFPMLATAMIVGVILLTALAAPHLGGEVPLDLASGIQLEMPRWLLGAVPAAMLLTLLAAEKVMAYVAGLPRLFITFQPEISKRADNLLRALTIGTLQGYELIVIGGLAEAQCLFLLRGFSQSGWWQSGESPPYNAVLTLEFGFSVIVCVLGFLLPVLYGRLGGRISGWPWHKTPTV